MAKWVSRYYITQTAVHCIANAMRSCEQSVYTCIKKNSHFREWQRLWTEPMCPAKATIYIDPTIVWPPVTHRIPVQMTSEYFHFAHRSTAEFFRRSCKWFNEKWVKMTSKFNGTQLRFNEKKNSVLLIGSQQKIKSFRNHLFRCKYCSRWRWVNEFADKKRIPLLSYSSVAFKVENLTIFTNKQFGLRPKTNPIYV